MNMIKESGSKYDDYSISPKIRQTLLHWRYELTKKDFFCWLDKLINKKWVITGLTNKKSCKKQKKDILKNKYYTQNKEAIKEKSKNRYKNLSQEEKDKMKEYQRKEKISTIG